ncbi:hypothetical protein FRC10_011849 [Ceratobasidium sp. 414]|nr:hypothetical protein FRC10_011849 [Ceratobasidium sp. 414]
MGPDAAARQELTLQPVAISQLCFFLTVYFAINPRLFHFRFWLIPITLQSIWYLCTKFAFKDPTLNSYNFGMCSVGLTIAIKLFELAAFDEPPKYDGQPACSRGSVLCWNCVVNTMSYLMDPRCLHWNTPGVRYIPGDVRRDGSHAEFYIDTLAQAVKYGLYSDVLLAFIMNMDTFRSSQGGTIFRDTFAITSNYNIRLPPFLGAFPLTIAVGLVIMNTLKLEHCLVTLLAAPLTWLPPSISPHSRPASLLKREWPPLFDRPSQATSLGDFWTNRWQGSTRRCFAFVGGKPGRVVGGYAGRIVGKLAGLFSTNSERESRMRLAGSRIGYVMGTFLASGLVHDAGTWGMGQGMDLPRVTGYFLLQGVGMILENALGLERGNQQKAKSSANEKSDAKVHRPTSSALHHYFMKLWVLLWVVLPATMMIEAWIKRGFAFVSGAYSPSGALFNAWNDFAFGK